MGTNSDGIYEDHEDNYREKPAHRVCLDRFYLDTYEVTQKKMESSYEFQSFCLSSSGATNYPH